MSHHFKAFLILQHIYPKLDHLKQIQKTWKTFLTNQNLKKEPKVIIGKDEEKDRQNRPSFLHINSQL